MTIEFTRDVYMSASIVCTFLMGLWFTKCPVVVKVIALISVAFQVLLQFFPEIVEVLL